MEIDAKLKKFKSEVSPSIGSMKSASSDLLSTMQNFKSTNDSAFSSIQTNYNSQGMSSVATEVTFLNDVTSKITQSIESELNKALTACEELTTGIEELEKLLEAYNTALNNYNSEVKNNPDKTVDKSAVNKAESDFNKKQEECLKKHDEITSMDASLTILAAFSTPADTSDIPVDSSEFGSSQSYGKYIYEENGIIYQRVVPIYKGKFCEMEKGFTIVYNEAKMLAADPTAGQKAIDFLRSQINGQNLGKKLWDFRTKIVGVSSSGIGKVMDVVLDDTYKANGCKRISDYASIAAMVMGTGLVDLKYGGSGKGVSAYGVEELIRSGATLDCIGFVRWCYYQGIRKTGSPDNIQTGSSMTPLNLYSYHSRRLATMTQQQKENLPIGSVLVKKTPNNLHVGVVVGYTTINGKKHILVSQSSGGSYSGSWVNAYDISTKFGDYDGGINWERVATPDMMEQRVTRGHSKETTVTA